MRPSYVDLLQVIGGFFVSVQSKAALCLQQSVTDCQNDIQQRLRVDAPIQTQETLFVSTESVVTLSNRLIPFGIGKRDIGFHAESDG